MPTIQEIAAECGVSRQAVDSYLKRNDLRKECTKDAKGRLQIPDDVAQQLLKHWCSKRTTGKQHLQDGSTGELMRVIEVLREQLESKDREIERLHEQLSKMQTLLDQSQQQLMFNLQRFALPQADEESESEDDRLSVSERITGKKKKKKRKK